MKFKGDTYTKAYKLLSVESNWTKFAMARDTNDNAILLDEINKDKTCKVCLMGAILIVYDDYLTIFRTNNLIQKIKSKRFVGLDEFNDHPNTTYDMVYNFLKENNI
jgi:hypothetical protein